MAEIQWHGDEARRRVRRQAATLIQSACQVVQARALALLSIAGTGQMRDARSGRFQRRYGANPSEPGEPPHKQTGRLRASVQVEVDEGTLVGRVGTNVDYGKFLELGTQRGLKPRPWLRRAFAEMAGRVNALLARIKTND